MAKRLTPEEVFSSAPPLTGGTAYIDRELIRAVEDNIHTNNEIINEASYSDVSNTITNEFKSKSQSETYNIWWLLNFMTDYFANLVQFNFKDSWLQKQVMQSLKAGIMFGDAGLIKHESQDKYISVYVSKYYTDEYGVPFQCDGVPTNFMQMTQLGNNANYSGTVDIKEAFFDKKNCTTIEGIKIDDENSNIVLFNPWSFSIGGIVRWNPFLKQMEFILKQLRTYGYALTKKLGYNVHDSSVVSDEIKLFMDPDVPVLVTLNSSTGLLNNKFNAVEFGGSNTTLEFIEYVRHFFDVYYTLLGRRSNNDKKKERNIAGEVDATQEQFDVLQHEIICNIQNYLDDVKKMTGVDYEIINEVQNEGMLDNAPNEDNNSEVPNDAI